MTIDILSYWHQHWSRTAENVMMTWTDNQREEGSRVIAILWLMTNVMFLHLLEHTLTMNA